MSEATAQAVAAFATARGVATADAIAAAEQVRAELVHLEGETGDTDVKLLSVLDGISGHGSVTKADRKE